MATALVVGAGPGLGRAVARRFAREGYAVGLIARRPEAVAELAGELGEFGVRTLGLAADVTDEPALRDALDRAVAELRPPDVVVYNAALIRPDVPGELTAGEHLAAWAVNVVGAHTTASAVLPRLVERGRGTLLFTGGMPEPKAEYVSLSLGKAGLRALVRMLDQRYRDSGVHVGMVTVDGPIAPGTAFDPEDIAEHYWRLHGQRPDGWQVEYVYVGSARSRA